MSWIISSSVSDSVIVMSSEGRVRRERTSAKTSPYPAELARRSTSLTPPKLAVINVHPVRHWEIPLVAAVGYAEPVAVGDCPRIRGGRHVAATAVRVRTVQL